MVHQGFLSQFIALRMVKKIGEVAVMSDANKEVKFYEMIKDCRTWVHVYARGSVCGKFLELKMANYEACNGVYLKFPE